MSWSYDDTDLSKDTESGRLNVVRFLVGDTDTDDQLVSNEEVVFALLECNNNVYYAGAWLAESIAASYARQVDVELDEAISEKASQAADNFSRLAIRLRQSGQMKSGALGVVGGGIFVSDVEKRKCDPTIVQPAFYRGMFDYSEGSFYDTN